MQVQAFPGVRVAAAGWRALSTGTGGGDGIFDVAVVGGGVMGVWSAIFAAKQVGSPENCTCWLCVTLSPPYEPA